MGSTGQAVAAFARKEHLRYQVEFATDIIYTTDVAGRFIHFNPQAHTILGFTREELLGRPYLDMVHPEVRESVRKFYGRQFVKRITNTYREIPCVAKDGSLVWLGQNVQFLERDGQPMGFQAVARDITKRVRAEELAKHQTAILEMIAKGAPLSEVLNRVCHSVEELANGLLCSVLLVDGTVLRNGASPSLPASYTNAVDGLPIGPSVGSCGTAAYRNTPVIASDIATDPLWIPYRRLALDHGLRACWSAPITTSRNTVLGTFAIYYTIPRVPTADELALVQRATGLVGIAIERDLAAEELRRLNEELEHRVAERTAQLERTNDLLQEEMAQRKRTEEQLLQAKKLESVGRLAGGVAHEFNNWLTVILLYMEQLGEQTQGNTGAAESIEEIRKAAERAAALTRQLLAFGRKQVLQTKPILLNQLLLELTNMLRSLMGVQIRVDMVLTPELGLIRADRTQIEQVIVNLALNARDAMPRGGTFSLRTSNVVVPENSLPFQEGVPPGRFVLLEVSDTGVGMDSDVRERIFEPFFTTKEPGRGSGLGLATVYGVIQQSGGQILVSSAPQQGATFRVYMPAIEGDLDELVLSGDVQRESLRAKRIVVVDDDESIRRLIARALSRLGYDVIEALNPVDAIALCHSAWPPIDLLLTDMMMPAMSGRELASRILAVKPATRVLFISGYTNNQAPNLAGSGACEGYLAKPFSSNTLANKVFEVLSQPAHGTGAVRPITRAAGAGR